MELKQLEHLVAVCTTGSFSGAAKRLRISQPTLSKSIARLEKQLGVKLFDRTGGSARPNVYGHTAAEHAAAVLAGVERMSQQLEQLARGEAGSLRIGVGPATRIKLLPEVVRQVGKAFPDLQLEARYDDVAALMRSLRMGSLDLVFCYFEAPDELSDFIRVKICDDRRIAVVRPRHPALRQAPLTPEMLLRYPIASVGAVPSFRKWLGAVSARAARNMNAFVSDDYALLKTRPLESDYVALGPRFVFERELRDGTLVELKLRLEIGYECWMLTTESKWRSPVVKKVADFARRAMRRKEMRP
ncbi:LysR family transcriptional regulator [uncultured Reyranella sp.]|uniref:LysR family transcriptional regulator n=1 Tax=uncultured Reyranella sp. TaxID=735512 RepID=UPI00259CA07D|nr:LysR family transcriptional regulator [uncultured Reyranella sp.]